MLDLGTSNQQRQALTQNPTMSFLLNTRLWTQSNRTWGDAWSAKVPLCSCQWTWNWIFLFYLMRCHSWRSQKRFGSFSKLVNKKWLDFWAAVLYLVIQSCPTLCKPMDCSPPGSYVHGLSQARILEWVAISSYWGSSWPRDGTHCLLH